MKNATLVLMTIVTASFLIVSQAAADPPPGSDMLKFSQRPMIELKVEEIPAGGGTSETVSYYGHDELSQAVGVPDMTNPDVATVYNGIYMADDFADGFDSPVVHVKWWGSYINEIGVPIDIGADGYVPPNVGTQKFLIAFEDDVPATDNIPSHPNTTFNSGAGGRDAQIVTKDMNMVLTPGSGTYTEKLIYTVVGGESLFEYNAELHVPRQFPQEEGTVYWLKIVNLVDVDDQGVPPAYEWGWHNRDYTQQNTLASTSPVVNPGEHIAGYLPDGQPIYHFQDDAVQGSIDNVTQLDAEGLDIHFDQGTEYNPDDPGMLGWWIDTNYVDGVDGPGPGPGQAGVDFPGIGYFSKDLAFELYTVPEPATMTLLALGGLAVLRRRRKR